MNERIKNTLLIGIMVLLISACGQLEATPAPTATPEPIVTVTEIPVNTPAPIMTEEAAPKQYIEYIGLAYASLPEGLSLGFSMLIQGADVHSLSLVTDGTNKMLWLAKITRYNENGTPIWKVKDVLELSNLEAGLTLLPDGCSLNGMPDSEIFVAGRNGVVVLAWRANTTLGKFEAIPVKGVQCNSDKAVHLE